jgi:hypothetical protein
MKSLSGKRWFYSLGQRSLHDYTGPWPQAWWPQWARYAFHEGAEAERWSRARQSVKKLTMSQLVERVQ